VGVDTSGRLGDVDSGRVVVARDERVPRLGEFYSEIGPKFIRAQNIRFGQLRFDDLACVQPPPSAEGTRTRVAQGDLLVVITGAGVTNPALLREDLGEAYVSQHVGLIRPAVSEVGEWLLLGLMAPAGCRRELLTRAYGAGKPGLNLENLRSLPVPLPPLLEQQRILSEVDKLTTLCRELEVHAVGVAGVTSDLLDAVIRKAIAGADEAPDSSAALLELAG
jgi:type I restriction enzyme, S subunit